MKILLIVDNIYEENCYIIVKEQEAVIIDPGFNFDKIYSYINENNLKLSKVILTHGHIDHTGELDKIYKTFNNFTVYISELDYNMLFDDNLNCSKMFNCPKIYSKNMNFYFVKDREKIDNFTFYFAPGHTKGSILIKLNEDMLFTGDTLFKGSVGRTDLLTGSMVDIKETLKMISSSFSKSINILPGHYLKTTLKEELKSNPYLKVKR